jgi:hypothetical protein
LIAISVQKLHLPLLHDGQAHLLVRLELNRPGLDVAELRADHGLALTGLMVLETEDRPQLAAPR